ncbi:TSC complex subunit 1a isoform X2 [Chanos chanos]|uniref:TSC complex subunit 1a isoform X2 n=1 Tax=Chanos chanos TaxID=29144 RepID=A0A6J2WT16_CHACN|nr:hamartin-like isoform X2 [Chanos chanos]
MAKEQPNPLELLPLLESTDLQEVQQVKVQLQELLSSDKGSLLLNGLVDYYLDTNSPQAVDILSSVREPHDKHLLDKMNECMAKQGCRLPAITLLGHVVRKQPSWIHKIARFPLLASLLKCLKTDSDMVVLITGVLVLITLLPMIPQTGKQLLFEVFDIFGRLAAWNQRNPGQAQKEYLVHLHASVYSLFHRLYGMYPCNFVSYLRAHYSMKENVDTFEEVVKPMLEHVRIHPELVTGTKDYELDPIRWKRFEPHDIVIECAKVSLDPKEASCEEGYATIPDHVPGRPVDQTSLCTDVGGSGAPSVTSISNVRQCLSLSLPHLTVTQPSCPTPPASSHQNQEVNSSGIKDVLWSPSSACGMNTPPSSRGMSPTTVSELSQSASHPSGRAHSTPVDGKWTPSVSTPSGSSPLPSLSEEYERGAQPNSTNKEGTFQEHEKTAQAKQEPIREQGNGTSTNVSSKGGSGDGVKSMTLTELSDYVKKNEKEREDESITEELLKLTESRPAAMAMPSLDSLFSNAADTPTGPREEPALIPSDSNHNLLSTPAKPNSVSQSSNQQPPWSIWPCFTPIEGSLNSGSPYVLEDGTPNPNRRDPVPRDLTRAISLSYEPLFDLALPRAASLFVERKTTEVYQQARGDPELSKDLESRSLSSTSPLDVLDELIQQGHDSHARVLKRSPSQSSSTDSVSRGKQHSSNRKGLSAQEDDLPVLRSQLLLLHNQLLYERYKREQHAIRNRRLLRRVINATALEEQNNSMKAQLRLLDVEMQALRVSLQEEQRRCQYLQEDREASVKRLQEQIQQLQQERDDFCNKTQELKSDLLETQKRVGEMEAELQTANNKVCNTGHLLSQLSLKLNNSENMEQQMVFLNRQLLLLGEANKLCVQEIQRLGPEANKELKMLQTSTQKEMERLRQSSVQQNQHLDTAQQRITDLEAQLSKKDQLILEQKKLLESVKNQAKGQLQASENRYLAQKHITQALQAELLQLYSQLEIHNLSNTSPARGTTEQCNPTSLRNSTSSGSSAQPGDQHKAEENTYMCVNGSVSPEAPQSPTTSPLNGSLEEDPGLRGGRTPTPLPCDSPLGVSSYPTERSLLGMRARQLFRNKSESQQEEDGGMPPLESLSLGLQADRSLGRLPENAQPPRRGDVAAAPPAPTSPSHGHPEGHRARAFNVQSRRQDLKIMDYNQGKGE